MCVCLSESLCDTTWLVSHRGRRRRHRHHCVRPLSRLTSAGACEQLRERGAGRWRFHTSAPGPIEAGRGGLFLTRVGEEIAGALVEEALLVVGGQRGRVHADKAHEAS